MPDSIYPYPVRIIYNYTKSIYMATANKMGSKYFVSIKFFYGKNNPGWSETGLSLFISHRTAKKNIK